MRTWNDSTFLLTGVLHVSKSLIVPFRAFKFGLNRSPRMKGRKLSRYVRKCWGLINQNLQLCHGAYGDACDNTGNRKQQSSNIANTVVRSA